jgi:hypothetical protein
MRYDRRYTRVLSLITDPAIPRTASGGIQLCKWCQRDLYFVGGFFKLLTQDLERMAMRFHERR